MSTDDTAAGTRIIRLLNPGPWVACPSCQHPNRFEGVPPAYFRREPIACAECGAQMDLWAALVSSLRGDHFFNAFAAIGAHSTAFVVPFPPGEFVRIDLADVGVPRDARVLMVNCTSMGGQALPLRYQTNQVHPSPLRPEIILYAQPVDSPMGVGQHSELSLLVIWLDRGDPESSPEMLAEAVELFRTGKRRASILFANAAVERALGRLLAGRLDWAGVSTGDVDEFLSSRATYSYQLRALLPLLARLVGVPSLADPVRQYLLALNKWRNKVAHGLEGSAGLKDQELVPMLAAAVFALSYMECFGEELAGDGS